MPEKPRNGKTGKYIPVDNPKSEMMRLTKDEKELILKMREEK